MSKRSNRIETDGGEGSLSNNPFGSLNLGDLPEAKPMPPSGLSQSKRQQKNTNRGRLDVGRQKSGRGGKTVTVISGFKGISQEEKAQLAKTIQKRCGVGGAVKQGNVEIQGDKREDARAILEDAGFRVVFVGG